MQIKPILLALFIAFSFTNCSDDGGVNDPVQTGSPGEMSCNINGSNWSAQASTIQGSLDEDPSLGDQLTVQGKSADGIEITLQTTGIDLKAYSYDLNASTFDAVLNMRFIDDPTNTPILETGSITITKHDASRKKVSGSFNFRSQGGSFVGNSGSFEDVEYSLK